MIRIVDLLCELYYNIDDKKYITSEVIHEEEADSKTR